MEDIKILNKKTSWAYFSSLLFLGVVILSTVLLYIYNGYLTNDINDIKTNITKIEANIKEVESDKNIKIYSLLQLNKKVIDLYDNMNKITKFITHMNLIEDKYDLIFSWFDLVNWEIKTEVKVISDDKWIAFHKARDFISKYRDDKSALFNLWFIGAFDWMDEIKFNVSLKIK